MTSRQRVIRALEFDHPDRVPRDIWLLPIARLAHGERAVAEFLQRWPVDFASAAVPNPDLLRLTQGDPHAVGIYRDEWGCEFVNAQAGVIGEVKRPLLDDWSKFNGQHPRIPREALCVDVDAVNQKVAEREQFMLAGACPRPFERLQFLRGSENVFLDLAEQSPALREMLARVHAFYCDELSAWARTRVDGLMFMDDWGSQRGMLIDPAQWRRWFKPLYADYVRIAHDAGKKAFMHSDGHIFEIYEDLIEIGVDAINSQLFTMDIEEIGRRFAGRITFWGEIDRQHILCNATPDEARQAVERVVRALHRKDGGVIAQIELGAGARLDIADAVFGAWADATDDCLAPSPRGDARL